VGLPASKAFVNAAASGYAESDDAALLPFMLEKRVDKK
jgi:hypothetical protein